MPGLTPEEIREIRGRVQDTIRELNRLLDEKGDTLSDKEVNQINQAVRELLNASNQLTANAILGTAQQIRESVQGIRDATNNANMALRRMKRVKKGIQIATALIGFGTAIVQGDPTGIISAANGVINVVNRAEDC